MWILESDKGEEYVLLVKEHIVGRKDADLVLIDDKSISRKHSKIIVNFETKDLGYPTRLPSIRVVDLGSKYGTGVNDGIEASQNVSTSNVHVDLEDGDRVRFGLQWNIWKVKHVPLVMTSSTLSAEQKQDVVSAMTRLGGHMVANWQSCCTHVTMANITLTVKAVCALARGLPIVTPEYWAAYVAAVSQRAPPPDHGDYLPPLAEATLNPNAVSLKSDDRRKTLFSDKLFIISTEWQYNIVSCMVEAAGGAAVILDRCAMLKEEFTESHVIVLQHAASGRARSCEPSQAFTDLSQYLVSKEKRVVPQSEIGLALLYCSLERYCNPEYNLAADVLRLRGRNEATEPLTLVMATQTQVLPSTQYSQLSRVIPESGSSRQGPKSTNDDNLELHPGRRRAGFFEGLETQMSPIGPVASAPDMRFAVPVTPDKPVDTIESSTQINGSRKRCRGQEDESVMPVGKRMASSIPSSSSQTRPIPSTGNTRTADVDDEDPFSFGPSNPNHDSRVDSVACTSDGKKTKESQFCSSVKRKLSVSNEEDDVYILPTPLKKILTVHIGPEGEETSTVEHVGVNSTFHSCDTRKHEENGVEGKVKNFALWDMSIHVKPLICQNRSPSVTSIQPSSGKNFKKFNKVQPMRATIVPQIITLRDLVLEESGMDLPLDWANRTTQQEQLEATQEQDDFAFCQRPRGSTGTRRGRR